MFRLSDKGTQEALLYQLSRIADGLEAANVIAASSAERDSEWFAWNREIAQGNANTQDVLQVAISNIVERVQKLEQGAFTSKKLASTLRKVKPQGETPDAE